MTKVCSFERCENSAFARGWCHKHYKRWQEHGDPSVVLPRGSGPRPSRERFARLTVQEGTCLAFKGALSDGYGNFTVNGKTVKAHRYAFEQAKGPIPGGMELDHLCRNRACVNPDHLEPVTTRENLMRGEGACANNGRKTECLKGHVFSGENLRLFIGKNGHLHRICRQCKKQERRERYLRSRYAA